MMKRLLLLLAMICLPVVLVHAQALPGPSVEVNGKRLSAPVLKRNGALLLPMRAVFEALEAEVSWFPNVQMITAARGDVTVKLWLNKPTAIVNDELITLASAPILSDGTTFVPLRFPAEAFGGKVDWDAARQIAAITIPPLEVKTPPATDIKPPATDVKPPTTDVKPPTTDVKPPATDVKPPATEVKPPADIKGVVISLNTEAGPALVVQQPDGNLSIIRLLAESKLLRGLAGGESKTAAFADIEPGDMVKITPDKDGKVSAVAASYAQATGKLAAAAKDTLLLQDGSSYQLRKDVRVVDPDGKPVALETIEAGREMTIRLTPDTKTVWGIKVAAAPPPPPPKPVIDSVTVLNYTHPLKAGDVLTVQVMGTPKADSVTVRVGDVIRDTALEEKEPGKYVQYISILNDTNAGNAQVTAVMRIGKEFSPEARSQQQVSIDTAPPTFKSFTPGDNVEVTDRNPIIDVLFDDENGTGIDTGRVSILADDQDVTRNATISAKGLNYKTKDLKPGRHKMRVRVHDQAGNCTEKEWYIIVKEPPVPRILTLTHSATKSLMPDQSVTITATLSAAPWKLEWYFGDKLISRSESSESDGFTYKISYKIRDDDTLGDNSVSLKLFTDNNHVQLVFADKPVRVMAEPKGFRVTSPSDKGHVGTTMSVSGEAPTGYKVRVSAVYSCRKGVILKREVLYKDTMAAGKARTWSTPNFSTLVDDTKPDEVIIKVELLNPEDDSVMKTETLTVSP